MLPDVDALVLAVGSMDTLPSPLPTALRELIPLIRGESMRRLVRGSYVRALPALSRAMARLPGGGLTVRYLERCRQAVSLVRPGCPVVAVVPSVHRAPSYGCAHPGRAAGERAIRGWASARGVGLLDLPALVGEHVLAGAGNPDGMHWGWPPHRRVGEALAALLAAPLGRAGERRAVD